MNEQKLLPCPFCGGEDVGSAMGIVNCYVCKAKIEVQNTNTYYASELWNTRAQQGDYHEGLNEGIKIGRNEIAQLPSNDWVSVDDRINTIVTQINCLLLKTIEYTKREECSIEYMGLYPELLDIKAKIQLLKISSQPPKSEE